MTSKFVIKEVLPRVPFLAWLTLAHSFRLLETSSKWDLKTTLFIRFMRSLLANDPPSISDQQKASLRDPGIQGPMWVSKVTVPPPSEPDALNRLVEAIDSTKGSGAIFDVPSLERVQAEWTGFRRGASAKTKHMSHLPEAALYDRLMNDTHSDVTVLYIHGGALFLMDPATHRPVCSNLSRVTGGRCLSVRYRLAPKYPFPAGLLDCLIAYLYLLSPPPGSYHRPVPASKIVFAGDSAGGTLSFALLQFILQLHRQAPPGQPPTVRFHGQDVPLPLPAGVAAACGWLDLTRSLPSIFNNAKWDYIPPPKEGSMATRFRPCELWPANPTREDLYCDLSMMMHPLASPLAAKSSAWRGSCPIFLLYGQEMLLDEGKVMCRTLAREKVPVQWDEFEGMPHDWQLLFQNTKGSRKAYQVWGDFITNAVNGKDMETRGTFHEAKTLRERSVDVGQLGDLTDAEVEEKMREVVRRKGLSSAQKEASHEKAKL